jgi:hypothetical protein
MIAELRARYPKYDAVLAFVKKYKLPSCKCSVEAMPRDHGSVSYGYSNSQQHVAAAICAVLEEEAQGEGGWEVEDLTVKSKGSEVSVRVEGWSLIWFTPLTPAGEKKAKTEWLKHAMALEKNGKPRAERLLPSRLGALLSKRDPFESGLILYPYMPGGEWG